MTQVSGSFDLLFFVSVQTCLRPEQLTGSKRTVLGLLPALADLPAAFFQVRFSNSSFFYPDAPLIKRKPVVGRNQWPFEALIHHLMAPPADEALHPPRASTVCCS